MLLHNLMLFSLQLNWICVFSAPKNLSVQYLFRCPLNGTLKAMLGRLLLGLDFGE